MKWVLAVLSLFVFVCRARAEVTISQETFYSGVCDASAGAMLNDDLFVAADDETNRLRVYSRTKGGAPLFELSLSSFLRVELRQPEADIEGAARVGDLVYWITSHGRNKEGKERSSRQRFFATRIVSLNPPKLEPFGRAYDGLLQDFENAPELEKLDLEEASELAPKEKRALNIEGLCARPDGSLLVGFRNPVPKKKALLVPLLNPGEVINGKDIRARFSKPIRLDLDGRGIRDIVQRDGKYQIIAGSHNSADRFELYEWPGEGAATLLHRWEKHTLNPEAILALPGSPGFLILTDEGSRRTDGRPCSELPQNKRHFRSVLAQLENH